MKARIPSPVLHILKVLEDRGYEAYVVGGCVRDSILGRTPDDWDITTSALPLQVKALFRRTVDTGLAHGTVTVMQGAEGFEVTTYRVDGAYEDGRHPKEVIFTPSLREDLQRRDFTINAMAYHPRKGLVDPFGGLQDLKEGIIRCVGEAEQRFGEDALRILRAVRFSAQLGFAIEEGTRDGIRKLSPTLEKISAERIQVELVKLLLSPHPEELRVAKELGILRVILPELDRCMEKRETEEQLLAGLSLLPGEKGLRLAMLLYRLGGAGVSEERQAEAILRRLKFDNNTIRIVRQLIKYRSLRPQPEPEAVRRAVSQMGEELFPLHLALWRADLLSRGGEENALGQQAAAEHCYEAICAAGDCVSLKTLAVTGEDLICAGEKPGKTLGAHLAMLLDHVLSHPEDNKREILLGLPFPKETLN